MTARALTTIFKPPASCSKRPFTIREGDVNPDVVFWEDMIQDSSSLGCYPQGWSDVALGGTWSPGVCPSGYYTYTTGFDNDATVARCCPIGFSTTSGSGIASENCYSSIGTPTSAYGISMGSIDFLYTLLPLTPVTPRFGVAYNFVVEWRERDLDKFVPKSAPVLSLTSGSEPASETSSDSSEQTQIRTDSTGATVASSGTATAGSTGNAGADATSDPNNITSTSNDDPTDENGLSKGAIAGVVVGICLFAILLIIGTIIFLIHRRRKARDELTGSNFGLPARKAELDGEGTKLKAEELPEMPNPPLPHAELPDQPKPPEPVLLDSREVRAELQ